MNAGDIYLADLRPTLGNEQQGVRPVLIVGDMVAHLPTVVPLTTTDRDLPIHVRLEPAPGEKASVALCEQVRAITTRRFVEFHGRVSPGELADVRRVLGQLLEIT